MSEPMLPPELAELEQELAGQRPSVGAPLEARVLRAVRAALAVERRRRRNTFALAAAAMLLIGLHLTTWATQVIPTSTSTSLDPAQLTAARETIRGLLPQLESSQAERFARRLVIVGGPESTELHMQFKLPRPYTLQGSPD